MMISRLPAEYEMRRVEITKLVLASPDPNNELLPHASWFRVDDLAGTVNQGTLEIAIPDDITGALRRTLEFAAWIKGIPSTARYVPPHAACDTNATRSGRPLLSSGPVLPIYPAYF
jgi:hypothetical protein